MTRGTIPYPECGLDNVHLDNVPIWRCKNGHQDTQIPAIDNLHLVMAQMLVAQPRPLRGPDVRFLRKFLGYSARQFSGIISLHHVTLSKHENDRTIMPRSTEALIRLFCAEVMRERFKRPSPRSHYSLSSKSLNRPDH